jgi:hypothetical protein
LTDVPVLPGLNAYLVESEAARQDKRERRNIGKLDAGFAEVQKVLELGARSGSRSSGSPPRGDWWGRMM